MSRTIDSIPESFKTKFEISPQLNRLIKQMGIQNIRDAVEPSISNEELDELLNKITIDNYKNRYLMEIVNVIVDKEGITKRDELINLKIKVLLDNLSKKMCKCVAKTKNIGLCRSSIFKKRNLDFIKYDCGDSEKNELSYDYGLGPLLKPSVSGNPIILRRPISSDGPSTVSSPSPVLEKPQNKTIDYSIPDEKKDFTSQVKLATLESKPMDPLNIDCSKFDKYTCRKPCKWNGFKCY
jgi:hypothetical protein